MGIIRALLRQAVVRRRMPIEPPETIETDTETVACEGNDPALGHPRVFLSIGKEGFVECPYCDRRFVLKAGAAPAGH